MKRVVILTVMFMFVFFQASTMKENAGTDLEVSIFGIPELVGLDDEFYYRAYVINYGPDNPLYITFEAEVPEGMQYLSGFSYKGGECGITGSKVTCVWTNLAVGQMDTVIITMKPVKEGEYTATATVSSDLDDPNPSNNQASCKTAVVWKSPAEIGTGVSPSMALDATGKVHLCYLSQEWEGKLMYATNKTGAFIEEIIDGGTDNYSPAIAVDKNNNIHIAWGKGMEYSNFHISYINKSGSQWSLPEVVAEMNKAVYIRIRTDQKDSVHISCKSDIWQGTIRYFKKNISWSSEIVNNFAFYGYSFELDTNGHAHFVYHYDNNLTYRTNSPEGTWQGEQYIEELQYYQNEPQMTDIVIDKFNRPHVSYIKRWMDAEYNEFSDIKYAYKADEAWSSRIVQTDNYMCGYNSIDTDNEGNAHICFHEFVPYPAGDKLVYAAMVMGDWKKYTIDFPELNSRNNIAADSMGYIHIAYGKGDKVYYLKSGLPEPDPEIILSTDLLDFVTWGVGDTTDTRSVVIGNSGDGNLIITEALIMWPDAQHFSISRNSCSVVAPGDTCSIGVVFHPKTIGDKHALLSISSNDPVNPLSSVSLKGKGLKGMIADYGSQIFGEVLLSDSMINEWTLKNVGNVNLVIEQIYLQDGDTDDFYYTDIPEMPFSISPDDSVNFNIVFKPTQPGPRSVIMRVYNSDTDLTRTLSGIGMHAGHFEEIIVNFDSLAYGNAIWGDLDNDGDLDILICGEKPDGTKITAIYINNAGVFEKSAVELEGVSTRSDRSMAFTDLNNDGYLDFIITGVNNSGESVTNLYINDRTLGDLAFRKYSTDLPDVSGGSVDWGDFDNDGDPDLLLTGKKEGGNYVCGIYRNDGSEEAECWSFTPSKASFRPLKESTAVFVDFNKDDYLDVVTMGVDEDGVVRGSYYTSVEGTYIVGFLGNNQRNGSIEFCDFDTDGNVEILMTGNTSPSGAAGPLTSLLRFTGNGFTELPHDIEHLFMGSADWGDFDNDGDYDLIVSGKNEFLGTRTILYENRNGTLVNSGVILPAMCQGTVRWGDFDNDGNLDLLLSGYTSQPPHHFTAIYRNTTTVVNTPPSVPGNLEIDHSEAGTRLSWELSSDAETPVSGLTYNISLKPVKGYKYIVKPLTDEEGTIRFKAYGNAFDNSILLKGLREGGLYSCRIEALDAGFKASGWSDDILFNVPSDYFLETDIDICQNLYEITSALWIDRDDDQDLDLLIGGYGIKSNSEILINDGENLGLERKDPEFGFVYDGISVIDLNNDNTLDYSYGLSGNGVLTIASPGKEDILIETGIVSGKWDFGDYENDGDPDLLITGETGSGEVVTRLFRNNNGVFEKYNILIASVVNGDIKWIDFDNDGDLDIAITGYCDQMPEGSKAITRIYENRGGAFVGSPMELTGLWYSSMDFADYDNDGYPDLLICGLSNEGEPKTIVYRNVNGVFTQTYYNLTPICYGDCKWVDINNDGRMDVLLTGLDNSNFSYARHITDLFLWETDRFKKVASWDGFGGAVIAAGDYDGDNKTDLLVGGVLYRNNTHNINYRPTPPENIIIYAFGDSVRVEWQPGSDNSTPPGALTYNLRLGTTPGGSNIVSPKAHENGLRKVVEPGNLGSGTSVTLKHLARDSVYYLAIQSIDNSLIGSEFSVEHMFNPVSGWFIADRNLYGDTHIKKAAWLDYDSDKDLDLVVIAGTGENVGIYRNSAGSIDPSPIIVLDSYTTDRLLVNDFNNDNHPDLSLARSGNAVFRILENLNGTFTVGNTEIDGMNQSVAAWGDFNNDGDEDLIIMGMVDSDLATYLYRNKAGVLSKYSNLIQPSIEGSMHWIDLNNNGYKDLVRSGYISFPFTDSRFIVSKNMGGAFVERPQDDIPGLIVSDMDFADFDNDGDLDLLFAGARVALGINPTYICTNASGTLVITDSLQAVSWGAVRWMDFNSDGLPDIIISGYPDYNSSISEWSPPIAEVYMNTGDGFVRIAGLEAFEEPALAIGDYNNDMKTDLLIGGWPKDGDLRGVIYRNMYPFPNTSPEPPSILSAQVYEDSVRISWNSGIDNESSHLCYNLRIGTTPGGNDVLSSLSHEDGYRKRVNIGNMQMAHTFTFRNPAPATTYYYSVQSIDHAYAASQWAEEREFISSLTGVYEISGSVKLPDNTPITEGIISILKVSDDGTFEEYSSKSLEGSASYSFSSVPLSSISLRFTPDSDINPGYLTTYLGDSPHWPEADRFLLAKDTSGIVITLAVAPVPPQGTSDVSGNLYEETGGKSGIKNYAGKNNKGIVPIENAPVYLMGKGNVIIAHDITDSGGKFEFANMAPGSYFFVAEYMGYPMDSDNDSLVIVGENEEYEIYALASGKKISAEITVITSTERVFLSDEISLFPNPVKEILYINAGFESESLTELKLINILGEVMLTKTTSGGVIALDLGSYNPGLYFIILKHNHNTKVFTVIKQ